jgi:hypothetical protein
MRGLQVGRWHLRGDVISCWDLEDQMADSHRRGYSMEAEFRLRSTSRGKMWVCTPEKTRLTREARNKLTMNHLRTANKATGEVRDVDLQHTKAWYFSCVRSYEGL